MKSHFLEGADQPWVDYSQIDNDVALDDIVQQTADAEDSYFDSEEPSVTNATSSSLPGPRNVEIDIEEYNESNNWGF